MGALPDAPGGDKSTTRSIANVEAVKRVAEQTGLNVVLGTGHYRDPYLDREWFDRTSVDDIAQSMVSDITEGFGDTGVRAGIIGEIGCDKWYVSAAEERSFRAAARAHLATGAPIYTHAARWTVGHEQLDLLEREGVEPARVAVGHCDLVPVEGYAERLAARGAFVGARADSLLDQRRALGAQKPPL